MSHQVFRVASKYLYNKPLLTTQTQLEDLVDYVDSRGAEMAVKQELSEKAEDGSLGEGDIAIIPVSGALTYEETWMDAMCGMSSYQGILNMTRQAVKEGFTTIIYDVNSGGGEAYSCFESAQDIKRIASEAGVKTIAYVDGISASAAYALSVACDEVIVNPQAEVGSVGVVSQLRNTADKDKKEGVKYTYVYAGDSKIPYDAEGNFSKSFIDNLQVKIDGLYENFLTHVSEMRGIEKEAVRSTQAKMFSAQESLGIGFVDKIMTRNEFAEYLADIQEGKEDNMSLKSLSLNINEEKEKMQIEEMQKNLDASIVEKDEALSQLSASNEQLANLQEQLVSMQAEKETLEASITELNQEKQDKELSSRKEQLSAVLASDKVDSVFAAVSGLEQTSFDAIVASYAANKTQLNSSELFQEVGVSAEGEQPEDANAQASVLALIKSNKAK